MLSLCRKQRRSDGWIAEREKATREASQIKPHINQEKKFYIQKNYLKMPNFTIQKKVILLKDWLYWRGSFVDQEDLVLFKMFIY